MKKFFFLFFISAFSLIGQTPQNIFVGKMTCSARQISADEIQVWCRRAAPSNRVVVNQVIAVIDFGIYQWYYEDHTPGEIDARIIWMFWTKTIPGPLSWQAAVTIAGKEGPVLNGEFSQPPPQVASRNDSRGQSKAGV